MLSIGTLTLQSNCILAPLSGISDLPFRLINRACGAELAFCEMINVRSLSYKSKRTRRMLATSPEDTPLGVQILGCEDRYILKSIELLRKNHSFSLLDFNAACPAKKVVRRGEGASLLKDPARLHTLLKLIVQNVDVPVTVKIRTGWDRGSRSARDIALKAQDAGIHAVFIHGRTQEQGYAGPVDYALIREVKESLSIPVIASGDIFSPQHVRRMFEETGCDGVVIARGALGNPWIFQHIPFYLQHGFLSAQPDRDTLVAMMRHHLEAACGFYGEKTGVVSFRKFFAWYTKGLRKVRLLREEASMAKTRELMLVVIEKCR